MTRGSRANTRGKTLENAIFDLLSEEYEAVSSLRFFALRDLKQPIFAEQCTIGHDIYGKQRRIDFILRYYPFDIRYIICHTSINTRRHTDESYYLTSVL